MWLSFSGFSGTESPMTMTAKGFTSKFTHPLPPKRSRILQLEVGVGFIFLRVDVAERNRVGFVVLFWKLCVVQVVAMLSQMAQPESLVSPVAVISFILSWC